MSIKERLLVRDILRHLFIPVRSAYVRPSYWLISKELNISPAVVKRKLVELTEKGVITDLFVSLDPSFFKWDLTAVFVEANVTQITKLLNIMDSLDFVEAVGGTIQPQGLSVAKIRILHRAGESLMKKVEQIKLMIGDLRVINTSSYVEKKIELRLTATDVAILREIFKNPLARISDIKNSLKLSDKTVSRSLRKLTENRVYNFNLGIRGERSEGFLFYGLVNIVEEQRKPEVVEVLRKVLDDSYVYFQTSFQNRVTTVGIGFTISEVIEAHRRVKEIYPNAILLFPPFSLYNRGVWYYNEDYDLLS